MNDELGYCLSTEEHRAFPLSMRLLPAFEQDNRPKEERVNPKIDLEAQFMSDLYIKQREFALCLSQEPTKKNQLKT